MSWFEISGAYKEFIASSILYNGADKILSTNYWLFHTGIKTFLSNSSSTYSVNIVDFEDINEKSLKMENIYCLANTLETQKIWMFYDEYASTYFFIYKVGTDVFLKFINISYANFWDNKTVF